MTPSDDDLSDSRVSSEQFDRNWEVPNDVPNTKGLKSVLSHLTKNLGQSAEKLISQMKRQIKHEFVPSHDVISRFLNSKLEVYRFRSVYQHGALIYYIGFISHEEESQFAGLADHEGISFRKYCEQYFQERSVDEVFRQRFLIANRNIPDRAAESSRKATELVGMLNYLGLPPDAVFGADRAVFSSDEIEASKGMQAEKHFVTYRYGVPIGGIFKSFVTLIRQKRERNRSAPLLFTQKLCDRNGNPRLTKGFCVTIAGKLYLVGNLDGGAALEVIAISNVSPARKTMTGLALSISVAQELLSARIVISRIENKLDYQDVGLRRYDELSNEIKDLINFKDMLANKIEFELTRDLIFDGRRIEQAAMVAQVANLLGPGGDPRLKYADNDGAFNPADSREYTYNSALKEYD
jgi:hypothetical protein